MTISECDIENNRVQGDGGALRVSYTSIVTVDFSKFIENHGEILVYSILGRRLVGNDQ